MTAKRSKITLCLCLALISFLLIAEAAPSLDGILMEAIQDGKSQQAEYALAAGANPNGINNSGVPLAEAIKKGHITIVKLLVDNGANYNLAVQGFSLPAIAALWGRLEIVDFLLDKGLDKTSLEQTLAALAGHGDLLRVERLLKMGVSVEASNPEGTALIIASRNGQIEIVAQLLSRGADPNASSPGIGIGGDESALAAGIKYPQIVKLLVDKGANINIKVGRQRSTVLMVAVTKAPLETVRVLVEAGADVNTTNEVGVTALAMAKSAGRTDVVDYLLTVGAL